MTVEPTRRLLNECEVPTGKHYLILGMSWAGWLFDFYDLMLFSFLLVPIKKTLGLDAGPLSLLLGASLAATAVGGIVFGCLADRFGRKTVLSWTILIYSVGTFLCGFAHGVVWLLVFRVITGLGVGGEWATGQTLVGETFPARMRARFAAVMQTGAPLGIALAAIVGGFVEPALVARFGEEWGWRGCFFISVLPGAAGGRHPPPHARVGRLAGAAPASGGARAGPPARPARHARAAPAVPGSASCSRSPTCRPTGSPTPGCRSTSTTSSASRWRARASGCWSPRPAGCSATCPSAWWPTGAAAASPTRVSR